MIEGIEPLYRVIGEGLCKLIPEEWSSAKYEAIFHPGCITYFGEYVRRADGVPRSTVGNGVEIGRAILEMRTKFKDAGKRPWGHFCFEMDSSGKFQVNFGYEQCDADGYALFDEDKEVQRSEERRKRLNQAPATRPPG